MAENHSTGTLKGRRLNKSPDWVRLSVMFLLRHAQSCFNLHFPETRRDPAS
jgi:hypothetical protein